LPCKLISGFHPSKILRPRKRRRTLAVAELEEAIEEDLPPRTVKRNLQVRELVAPK